MKWLLRDFLFIYLEILVNSLTTKLVWGRVNEDPDLVFYSQQGGWQNLT